MGLQHSDQQIREALRAAGGSAEKGLDILFNCEPRANEQPQAAIQGASSYGRQYYQPQINNGQMQNGYGQPSTFAPTESQIDRIEKDQIQQALLQDQQLRSQGARKANDYEPLPVNERQRDPGLPCGLKNIGNTCYFASLVQALFFLPNIQEKMLSFDDSRLAQL